MSWSSPTDRPQSHGQSTIEEYGDTRGVGSHFPTARARHRLILGISMAVLLLGCATALIVFRLGSIHSQAQTHMAGQLRIFLQVDDYVDATKDAEKAQRDFLLSDDESHLDHYTKAFQVVKTKLAALQLLAQQGEIYTNKSARLTELTTAKLAELDKSITLQRTRGASAALGLLRQSQYEQSQIESEAASIRADEQREFDDAASDAEWAGNLRNRMFVGGLLLNIFFFWWAYRMIATELDNKQAAARDMAILRSVAMRCTRADDDFDDCLHEILLAAKALTNATTGTLRVLDERGNIRLAVKEGLDDHSIDGNFTLTNSGAQIFGMEMTRDQHVGVQDVSTSAALRNSPWAERLLKAGVRSFVAAPLMSSSERLLGIITVGFPRPGRPTETQIHFLDLLAREAADYLERKQIEKQLAHAHDQLADRAVHLEQLVKERTARLQEMIDDMDAFSYSLVHDMRAPLRAMQTFAEVLKEDCRNLGPIAQDYIHRIQVASQRIDHLIREGLYYSRFMREDMPLSPLNPKELLLGIVETYPQFAQCRQSISICGEFPMVRANEAALTQCFSQLLDNAVKFVTPGAAPAIVVWCEPARSRARIYFRDNGVGINAEGRAQIYKIFRKLDNEHRGTGIGLAIVKKAVERMGGTAGVVSDPQGSIFWLELGRAGTTQNPKPDVPQESLAEAI